MFKAFLFIFMALIVSGCNPKAVGSATDELTLYYIDKKIYDPTICQAKEIDGSYYVLCHPSGDKNSGGLYKIEHNDSDKYVIRPINGKAIQHVGSDFGSSLKDSNINIGKIIESF